MKPILATLFRTLVLAFVLACAGAFTAQAQTQPPAGEKELLEYLKNCPPGKPCDGRVSIPDRKSGTLVQAEGRTWQERMEGPVKKWGGWFLIGVLVLLALFY